jgi:hypothetical protein
VFQAPSADHATPSSSAAWWHALQRTGIFQCDLGHTSAPPPPPQCNADGNMAYVEDGLNGTVYRTLAASEAGCCAACSADGAKCRGWSMPRRNGSECRLLMEPLVQWDDAIRTHGAAAGEHNVGGGGGGGGDDDAWCATQRACGRGEGRGGEKGGGRGGRPRRRDTCSPARCLRCGAAGTTTRATTPRQPSSRPATARCAPARVGTPAPSINIDRQGVQWVEWVK